MSAAGGRRSSHEKRERLLSESDETNLSKMSCTSAKYSSLDQLEDLVTCPIHKGMLTDPRVLPCGHAFCLGCLEGMVRNRPASLGPLACPLCRCEWDVPRGSGCEDLPRACTHNRVVEYVFDKKMRRVARSRKESMLVKVDLLKSLRSEISARAPTVDQDMWEVADCVDHINDMLNWLEQSPDDVPGSPYEKTPPKDKGHSPSGSSIYASDYELVDIDTILMNMRKFSSFKVHREMYCRTPGISCADVVEEADGFFVVMLNAQENALLLRNNRDPTVSVLRPTLDDQPVTPIFVKYHRGELYVSCILDPARQKHGVLIQYSMDGKELRRSGSYPAYDIAWDPIGGFFIDADLEKVFLALPSDSRVAVLDFDLTETASYELQDLHPTYIARKADSAELWVSCPNEGRLVVIDETTGLLSKSGKEQIHGSVPTHIIYTLDQRIVFLDSRQERIFWVVKRNEHILVQRIQLGGNARDLHLSGIQAISDNGILLTSHDRVCVVRPSRLMTETSHHRKHCSIL